MPTIVKVRKWGNSLGIRLPREFAKDRAIADGSSLEIDLVKVVEVKPRRRSRYKLHDVLKNHLKPPRGTDFAPRGKEMA